MHQINPAASPPAELFRQAAARAQQLHKPVYLYQCSQGWNWVEKITAVPAGSLITEIVGNSDAPEAWNTGGC